MNNINYAGIAYALAAAITWGMVYVFDQRVLTKISPLNWLFIASLIMVIITFPIAILNWESVKNVIFSDNKHVIYFIIGAPILAALAEFLFIPLFKEAERPRPPFLKSLILFLLRCSPY